MTILNDLIQIRLKSISNVIFLIFRSPTSILLTMVRMSLILGMNRRDYQIDIISNMLRITISIYNWLDYLFRNFLVLCLGLATFPSSDGKPHGPSEPLETPTPAMRSEPQTRATGFQDSFF